MFTRYNLTAASLSALLIAGLLFPYDAWALRCGPHLIKKGDAQEKVVEYCGEPVEKKAPRYVQRPGVWPRKRSGAQFSVNGSEVADGEAYIWGNTEVLIEEWTFNFGPRKLMRMIRFGNGYVEEVKTLGYGYNEDD
jgi:hypothetical protein